MASSVLSRLLLAAILVACAIKTTASDPAIARADDSVNQPETLSEDRPLDAQEIYKARQLGLKFYSEKKYDEAFPHLMTAATHGFKNAQAQLGFMHLSGLGGANKDTRFAIGWLGVAADGMTEPPIKKYFKDLWSKIPREHQPSYQQLVDNFVAKYGADSNGLKCNRVNKPGSKIRIVRCSLTDANGVPIRDELDEVLRQMPSPGQSVGGGPGF